MGYKVVGVGLLLVGDTITGLFEEMTFELKLMKKCVICASQMAV